MSHLANPEPTSPPESALAASSTVRAWLIAGTVVLVALAVRLASATPSGLQIDEAQGIWIARLPTARSMVTFLAEHESHPPLYYVLLRGWMGIFGDSQASVEALSLSAGLAAVAALIAVGSRVFSTRVGLLAGLLGAFSPSLVFFGSTIVRPYPVLTLLWLGSTFGLWRALKGGRWAPAAWVGHVLTTVAMLFIHNWGWLALGGQGLVTLGWIAAGRRWRTLIPYAVAELTIAALYAPWVPTLLYQVRHAGYGPAKGELMMKALRYFTDSMLLPGFRVGLPIVLVLVAAAIARRWFRPAEPRVLDEVDAPGFLLFAVSPLVAFAAATILSRWTDLVHPHTATIVAPGTAIGLALVLDQLSGPGRWRATTLGLIVALAIESRYTGISIRHHTPRSTIASVSTEIDRGARPGDLVLVTPQWLEAAFDYYSTTTNTRVQYPDAGVRGAFHYDGPKSRMLDPDAYRRVKAELAQARREGRRVWFVVPDGRTLIVAPQESPDVDRPASFEELDYTKVGLGRAVQLGRYLVELYGGPGETIYSPPVDPPTSVMSASQNVEVQLFRPPGRAASVAIEPAAAPEPAPAPLEGRPR